MRKIRESVRLMMLLTGAAALVSLGCGSSSSSPVTPGGKGGAGGGGISLGGNKDGGASTGGTIPSSVALTDLPATFGQVLCDKAFTCCTAAELMGLGFPATAAECSTNVTGNLQKIVTGLQSSITAGRVVYHGDKMAACLKATQAQSCPDARTGMSAAGAMTNCDGAFEGKVALAGVCLDSVECIGGFCGVTDPNATMGMCVAKVANGAPCQDDVMCTSDYCSETTMVCEPPAPAGGLCE